MVLAYAVGPAVGEEVFNRGLLGHLLLSRYGVVLGVLLTSLIFGLMHGFPHAIFAFVLGCYFHAIYLATRSLWVPILMHFLADLIGPVFIGCGFVALPAEPEFWLQVVIGTAATVAAAFACWAFATSPAVQCPRSGAPQ
jgi:membrane protease YdiL (CAAX protease family)